MLIRDAESADWAAIWPFFSAITGAGETFTYPLAMAEADARALWMVRAPGRNAVAVGERGQVVGSAQMYANRWGNGDHVASASYMVDPAHQGRGAGRALVLDSLDWARGAGFRGMQFNAVVAGNTAAVGLYESLGFAVIGTVPGGFRHPVHGFVGLHVMYRPLP